MLRSTLLAIGCLLVAINTAAQSLPEPITASNAADVALLETIGRGVIRQMSWSPDSAQLAVATSTGLYLHDASDIAATPLYVEVSSGARSLAYTPDGARIATGSEDGTITVWDAASHETIFSAQQHLYPVNAVAWSPDGIWLVSGDDSGLTRVWAADTGEEIMVLIGAGSINSLAFSDNGFQLLVGSESTVVVWNAGSWSAEVQIDGASMARWFPDDERILTVGTGDEPRSVTIWDAQTGRQLILLPHSQTTISVNISPDGQWVATGSLHDGWLWNASTGVAEELPSSGGPLAFSPDGTTLGFGLYPFMLLDMNSHEVREELSLSTGDSDLRFSPDGQRVAAVSFARLRLIDMEAREASRTEFDYRSPLVALVSSINGNLLVGEETGRACIRYLNDETRTHYCGGSGIFDPFRAPIVEVAFPPNADDYFAWGAPNGYVGSESLAESESPDIFEAHEGSISGIVYIRNGEQFVTAGEDASLHVYQTATITEVVRYEAPAPIESLALHPDGGLLAAGDSLNHIQIWALGGKLPRRILDGHDAPVRAVIFSVDGAQLASGGDDGVIMLWNTADWAAITTLHGHVRGITSLAYSADGSVLASGSLDGTIGLWDTRSGDLLATLKSHTGGVTGVAFLADGRLASASYDGTIRLWGMET
jgi:WD40 repeat protein